MLGITAEKLFVITLIAVFLIGPQRLPAYAAGLARFVRAVRNSLDGLKQRARDELGPDAGDIDWQKLDPRQYDPRRIIREALTEPTPATAASAPAATPIQSARPVQPEQHRQEAPDRHGQPMTEARSTQPA